MPSSNAAELAREQAYVTVLYERLDALRAATSQELSAVRLGLTAENDQALSERESFARLYQDRSAELDAAERNLCFGRLDLDDGELRYIGRLGLRNDEYDQLLVDWRAPAAAAFYRATALQRYGVTRRRHLYTESRRVVRLDDDVLDLGAVDQAQLTGEAALLASLRRHRTGRMGDIVATIQADQDRIIRDGLKGILVVEGGPGTGKTVVALHRAAYLLYTYRAQLARRGILVIGPNATFMRYIDQVLPSLGENDVVLATIGSLYPGVEADASESPQAAQIKGRHTMTGVLERAVADLQRVPDSTVGIKVDGTIYWLTPQVGRKARANARRQRDPETGAPLPHNAARRTFVYALLGELARQAIRDQGDQRMRYPGDIDDLRSELADEPAIRRAIDVLWPELTPQQLLALLYAQPQRLDLTDDERAAILRDQPGPWTPADVPLLDELAELLGPVEASEQAARRRQAAAVAEQAEAVDYAAELVGSLVENDAIVLPVLETEAFVKWIANRNIRVAPAGSLAERALADRNWTYGHVVVDEAQELSAMAWRMLLRRCPSRSMTVVGDLAQTGAAGGADSWAQVLDPVVPGRWRTLRLTVNYRTPKAAMALAAALLPPTVEPPLSVRDGDEAPWCAHGDLAALVHHEAEVIGAGRVAVIAPPSRIADTAAALDIHPGPDLDAPIAVLTPVQAKGLEFDSVVVVDPGGIEQASPRGRADLYVALTRTTRRLGLVISGDVPPELAAVLS
ncbi:MAG TPA: ATP-binding domain-containing protein [Actinomycetes bacterium]|jgi:DNA helicase IV|nr:ATP-binding domain-containing protein [Actinomycetes bacterium]